MPWRGPQIPGEYPTLGYDVLDWVFDWLPAPNDERAPFEPYDDQAKFVLRYYRLDDKGRFVYRRAALEWAKGKGKSPLAAAIALAEFVGPVRFGGWDAEGEPVGVPWGWKESPPPWIQICAVSEDQTDNTYGALYALLVANDHRVASKFGIDDGRTRLYLPKQPGAKLEPVTSSQDSREGQRVTFAVLDETHLWTPENRGTTLAKVVRRNAAKMDGRTLETTNAPDIGGKSVAESTGRDEASGAPGILYCSQRPAIEPDPRWSDQQMLDALDEAYGDSVHIDRRRILAEIRDPDTPWEDALRFYFNVRVPAGGKAVDPRAYDALTKPRDVEPGERVALGFASMSHDRAVIRGCTGDGYLWTIAIWERPLGDVEWSVPRSKVDAALEAAFGTWDVGRFIVDPPRWRSEVERWAETWGDDIVIALDTISPRRFAPSVDRWLTAIREGKLTHDGDAIAVGHVRAAHLRKVRFADDDDDARTRYVITRGGSGAIDAAVADVLALEAASTMPEESGALMFVTMEPGPD